MRIVVLVKHIPCAWNVRARLGDACSCAVEIAWRMALRHSGMQVTAITAGPTSAIFALERALMLGADEGVHISAEGCDALGTSKILAAAVRRIGYDLVLCGASRDGSVIPAMVAERLGVPALCYADSVRAADSSVHIRRDDGREAEILAAELPAVVSVTARSGPQRFPGYRSRAQAQHKLVRTWALSRLDIGEVVAATHVRAARRRPSLEPAGAAGQLADFLASHEYL